MRAHISLFSIADSNFCIVTTPGHPDHPRLHNLIATLIYDFRRKKNFYLVVLRDNRTAVWQAPTCVFYDTEKILADNFLYGNIYAQLGNVILYLWL